ncbi:LysM peptidoglycan-binding domain-containing protein [Streptomyces sp. ASQP_92]|uniref:LysM peptidoglycan-binding domain-containing protein n=1 Tax=Streptomyces sp. ASQP_92 TaxID=2979116 RepID=UPI0021C0B888|nr:LysM peptidoglycan-binding domain-containing protein [Streptomyces sp. ASQP_92]MCT9093532.1 LysM peptidoglycan-binding domain-containing protein [Streptomyces sp. ASQP_92]
MALPRPASRLRTLSAVLRALAALLTLAALLAGLPWLLWQATAALLPGGLDALSHLFTRSDTTSVALLFVAAVGWIGWLSFVVSLLVEIPARLRGRSAPRLPGLHLSQRAAATLVGSILVLLPTSTALAAPATAHAVTAAQLPGQNSPAAAPSATPSTTTAGAFDASPTPVAQRTYTVREMRPAESLWSIAEHLTGHGELYTKIAAANEGHTMADGTTFRTNAPIQPGWILQLPADLPLLNPTPAPAQTTGTTPTSAHRDTVRPGDSLWTIAEREYHAGARYQEIFNANRDKPQPTGSRLTDPDELEVGWSLDIPAPAAPAPQSPGHTTAPPSTDHPAPPPTAPAPAAPHDTPRPQAPSATPAAPTTTPSRPAPSASAPATPSTAPSAPATSSTPPAAQPSVSARQGVQLTTVAGAFALLAAAITGALALRRLLQRRRRTPGETIAIAEETSLAAAQLAEAAEPTLVDELDLALRTLAHHAQADGRPLPDIRAARLSQHTVSLLPSEPDAEPQLPFAAGEEGWWTLPAAAELLDAEQAHTVPAPYPLLTTIGATEDDAVVLLNLAPSRVILLNGTAEHIRETCTSLALELGMSPWAQRVEIMTLGFGEELPHLLPTSRIAHKREAAHAVRDLGDWMLTAYQQPEDADQPYLLLCATELDSDTAWQFAEAFDKAGDLPVVLVAPAAQTSNHFADAEVLDASSEELQDLDGIGLAVRLQRLEDAAFQQIAAELRISGQPPIPAEGAWQHVPAEPATPAPLPPSDLVEPTGTPLAVAVPSNSPGDFGAFPALMTATTDPAALRLVPDPAAPALSAPSTTNGLNAAPPSPDTAPIPSSAAGTPSEPDENAPHDLHAPEISVLGPIHVPGVSTGHGPRVAQLGALLYFKPGRSADTLCVDMDPLTPWSKKTLDSRLGDLRRSLGDDPDGNPYVPRRTGLADGYSLSPHVRCDWTRFQQLAERALANGPTAVGDLERALSLVRGKPFGPAPLPWAEPHQQEMVTRIVDVAHTVATWRMAPGPHHDLTAARQAVATGLDVDESTELLYRDWLRIEHAAGNRPGLYTASTRVQQVSRTNRCPLDPETAQLIDSLLGAGQRAEGY